MKRYDEPRRDSAMSQGNVRLRIKVRGVRAFRRRLRRMERKMKWRPGGAVPGRLLPFSKLRYRPSRRRRVTRNR